jgi:hypothetical protein
VKFERPGLFSFHATIAPHSSKHRADQLKIHQRLRTIRTCVCVRLCVWRMRRVCVVKRVGVVNIEQYNRVALLEESRIS